MPRSSQVVIGALSAGLALAACSAAGVGDSSRAGAGMASADMPTGVTAGNGTIAGQASTGGGSAGSAAAEAGETAESPHGGDDGHSAGGVGASTGVGAGGAGQPEIPPFSVRAVFGVPPDNLGAQDPTI